MSTRIRRSNAVRVVNVQNEHANRIGIVTSVSKSSGVLALRLLQTADKIEQVTHVRTADVELEKDISVAKIEEIEAGRAAYLAQRDVERAAYEARRTAEATAEYIAKRLTPVAPLVRHVSDDAKHVMYGEQRDGYVSDRITIYTRPWSSTPVPQVEVNWSALGTVSPEEALAFAQALASAAIEAMAIRAQHERDKGIVVA